MLCALADFFRVTTDELLGRNNKMQNIIVCDDATFMRETLCNIIREKGYKNIRLAENGKQLMDAISEKVPEIIAYMFRRKMQSLTACFDRDKM